MTRLARPLRSLVTALDAARNRHSHIVVETVDGRAGFALFGGWKARHRFERLYLGATTPLPVRPIFHRTATADDCRAMARRYGMVVFCGASAPAELAGDLLSIPYMVDMELTTPTAFEGPAARWTSSVKDNLRRIRKARFSHDVQPGDACVPEFCSQMLQPATEIRHGAEAYVATERDLLRFARTDGGEILRVFQDGKWVAANLNQARPDGYFLCKIGWRQGDPSLLKTGAVSAVYWFSLQRAAALGLPRVYLGGTMPLLDDGVLRYKSTWGARLSRDGRDWGAFHLLLDPSHADCRRFLRTHSLIARDVKGEYVIFSGGTPETVGVQPDLLASISRWYKWRDEPSSHDEAWADDVPRSLRPWLSSVALDADARCA